MIAPKQEARREVPDWARDDPLTEWYATKVWGKRVDEDDALFEVMALARRDAFRKAFHGWSIGKVAGMGPRDVARLLKDASIIRNRQKIEACIANARMIQDIRREHVSFCHWFYQVLESDDLTELQGTLRKTFRFMGPEIARMWLMACGRIPPHD